MTSHHPSCLPKSLFPSNTAMCVLRLPFCIGYFSHFLTEMHNRMPLQEGKVCFDSKIMAGMAWHTRYETVIASKVRKQSHEDWCTVCFIFFYLVWNSSLWDGAAHTKGGSSPVTINHKSISSQINTQALHFKAISFHPCSHRLKAVSWCEIYPIQLQNFPQSLIVLFQTLSSESLQRLR